MRCTIRVAWAAWLWMNSAADIIADVFANLWYTILWDIEYQSIIKWGVNYFDINVSDATQYLSRYVNVLIALDSQNLLAEVHKKQNAKEYFIIASSKSIEKAVSKWVSFDDFKLLPITTEGMYDNTYLLSVFAKFFGIPTDIFENNICETFKRKGEEVIQKNIQIFREIFNNYVLPFESPFGKVSQIWEKREINYGNKVIAYGALDNGLGYYSAYPMTPSSTILTEVIHSKKCVYLQAEDEIAVVNSALWASYTGARSMVGTSGGWFALMTEAISFAIQAEIPLTMVLSQRAGPSTGTPTFGEQGDMNFALNPSFWDFNHIVVVPSSLEDGYYTSSQALNLAAKYQSIVIVLIDKQFSEGKATLNTELTTAGFEKWKFLETPPTDYKRYELTEDGISPMVEVGTKNGDFIATSYEHDEYGATTESQDLKVKMTEKRWKKLENFFEKEGITGYEVINPSAKKMIITTSFITYTAREFVKNNPEFGLIIIHFLKPLDGRLIDELKGKDEVIFVEHNYSGQLENYITKELGLKFVWWLKITSFRKYNLMPFYYEDFEEKLLK